MQQVLMFRLICPSDPYLPPYPLFKRRKYISSRSNLTKFTPFLTQTQRIFCNLIPSFLVVSNMEANELSGRLSTVGNSPSLLAHQHLRSCITCHRRKIKCDKRQEGWSRCFKAGIECCYPNRQVSAPSRKNIRILARISKD